MNKLIVTTLIAATAFVAGAADVSKQVKADFADYGARPFVHYAVPPMSEVQRLADTYPLDGTANGTVKIYAAKDEYEAGAFEVWGVRDLGKVKFELGEFKLVENEKGEKIGGGGVIFPKANLDLKVVKCWYQNLNGWFSYFGDSGDWKLTPELLLNDEDLIRCDTKTKSNYARQTGADGKKREMWINAPREMQKTGSHHCGNNYWETLQPLAPGFDDAKTLQPVTVSKDAFRCFFLTAHVTTDIPAGVYRGEIVLKKGQETRDKRQEGQSQILGTIPVELHVASYTLPRPKCYKEPQRDFLVNFYHYNNIVHMLDANDGDWELAIRQFKPMVENMVAHGQQIHPWVGPQLTEICVDAGMRPDVFFDGPLPYPQESSARIADAKRFADEYDRRFGCHNLYNGWGDEPGLSVPCGFSSELDKFIGEWHTVGIKHFIAGRKHLFRFAGHAIDWLNINEEPTTSNEQLELWNSVPDKRCAWYAFQHVGAENPCFHRRQNGIGPWLSGYTAFMNYAHHLGPYNDDTYLYKPMIFAYAAHSGPIDTMAWEGFREGIDDIRYGTLLAELARKASASKDVKVEFLGKKAFVFLALVERQTTDLDTLRAEMRRKIDELLAVVPQDPVVPLKRLAPKPQAADAALAKELAPWQKKLAEAKPHQRGSILGEMGKVYRKYFRAKDLADFLEKEGDRLGAASAAHETYQFERAEKLRDAVLNDPKESLDNRSAAAWSFAFSRPEIWDNTNTVALLTRKYGTHGFFHGWGMWNSLSSRNLVAKRFRKGWMKAYRAYAAWVDAIKDPKKRPLPTRQAMVNGVFFFREVGDWAGVNDVIARYLSNAGVKPAERYEVGLVRKLFGAPLKGASAKAATEIVRAYEKENLTKDITPEQRTAALNKAGMLALMLCENDVARALEAYRAALYKPFERRRYTVRFTDKPIESVDWTGIDAEVSLCDRKYGSSTEMLVSDVATGNRQISKDTKDKVPMKLQIAANTWGLHIRCESTDPKADEVAADRDGGGSIESYLAPGKDKPYVCFMKDDKDNLWRSWNSMYDSYGYRRIDEKDMTHMRTMTSVRDGRVVNMLSISWDYFADYIPTDGTVWDYEALRWGRDDCAWSGSFCVHQRSKWGELVFALSKADRAKILRRVEEHAYARYLKETKPQHFLSNYVGHARQWMQPETGDVAYFHARVKTWAYELDEAGKVLGENPSDETILRLEANGTLAKWHNAVQILDRMRREWLER